ncbi:hypothetical protein, partial [Xenorhabdus sp. SGI246]|uniref:hypothetical protein n=1 Tax=Xenorhabdus sp. SGI246 TaxID=3158263 RepID=UPI00349FB12F
MRDLLQNQITFPGGWFLFINGEIPFYSDQGCTVDDFAEARKLTGYNKENGIYFTFSYESTDIRGYEPQPGTYVLTIRKYNYSHHSSHFGRCVYAEVKQTQCPKEFKKMFTDLLNRSAEQSTFEEVKRPTPRGKCTPQVQQCIHDFFTGVKKDRSEEIMALVTSSMYDEGEEDILDLRKRYYESDEDPFRVNNFIKSEIHKKVVSEIYNYFELLDKTRKLENGGYASNG